VLQLEQMFENNDLAQGMATGDEQLGMPGAALLATHVNQENFN
jgi:hypothetical protein